MKSPETSMPPKQQETNEAFIVDFIKREKEVIGSEGIAAAYNIISELLAAQQSKKDKN